MINIVHMYFLLLLKHTHAHMHTHIPELLRHIEWVIITQISGIGKLLKMLS